MNRLGITNKFQKEAALMLGISILWFSVPAGAGLYFFHDYVASAREGLVLAVVLVVWFKTLFLVLGKL